MNNILHVSYSEVEAYQRCPEGHFRGYVQRLKPKAPIKPLHFGTDFHALLQNRGDKKKLKESISEIREKFNDNRDALGDDYYDNIRSIFQDYSKQWKGETLPDETEHRFQIPIGKYNGEVVTFVGVIDEVYGLEKIGEHKTFSRDPSMISLHLAVQPALYAKARELETGKLPEIVQWDHIKSTPASAPPWLEKSQRFSAAKNSRITEWSYIRACMERGITPDPIMIEEYRYNNSSFFFRTPIEVNRTHVDRVFKGFVETVKQVVSKGPNDRRHFFGRDCSWCKFQPLCYAEYSGLDVDKLIESDFIQKERHEYDREEDQGSD